MEGYKAFNPDMTCNGKQYSENTVYEESGGKICNEGVMHFCENPLDTLDYYPLLDDDCNLTKWAKVEALADVQEKGNKRATTKLEIKECISLEEFIDEAARIIKEAASGNYSKLAASGDSSQLAASGNYSKLAASSNYSKLAASGDSSQLAASGNYSQLAASGDSSQLAASGNYSKLAASGDSSQLAASGNYSKLAASSNYSKLAASGDSSQLAASGNYSKLAASGNYSKLAASSDFSQLIGGKNAVVMCAGIHSIAKAGLGSIIAFAGYEEDDMTPGYVETIYIDGGRYKADTFYTLENAEIVEVDVEDIEEDDE
jgi:hypothetical protein